MHQMDNFSAIGSHISNQNHNKNHQEQQIEQHLSRAPSAMDPLMTGTLQSQVTQVRTLKSVMNFKGFTDLGTCIDYFVCLVSCEKLNFCFLAQAV